MVYTLISNTGTILTMYVSMCSFKHMYRKKEQLKAYLKGKSMKMIFIQRNKVFFKYFIMHDFAPADFTVLKG